MVISTSIQNQMSHLLEGKNDHPATKRITVLEKITGGHGIGYSYRVFNFRVNLFRGILQNKGSG